MKNIKSFINSKIKEKDIEFFLFVLFLIFMCVYYAVRIFKHAPWYDELYTYYYFISRGPIYSAIHWPVPNNHIGYSVLSGIVYEITHSPFIALRGISFIAAVANLILLFAICRKLFAKSFSMAVVCIYSSMWLVNNLSVQGRGYTLSTTMMLMCMLCMVKVVLEDEVPTCIYVIWAVGLAYGLYIVSSSLYWVVPICVCAGISLLILKKYKPLIKLIIYSCFAAICTAFLYLIVWLAIGSNLLIKEDAVYSQMGHVKLIASHPIAAAARGIEYMLATPYIQSVSREGYMRAFDNHWTTLLGQMYDATSILLIGLFMAFVLSLLSLVARSIMLTKIEKQESADEEWTKKTILLASLVLTMLIITPIVVIIQCKLPYYRVFSFYGVTVAIALIYVLYTLFGRLKPIMTLVIPILFMAFAFAQLTGADYNDSYGLREEAVYELMTANDLRQYGNVAVTDCNVEYMYKFVYDTENTNTDITNAQAVVVYNEMLNPDAEYAWENYYDYDSIDHDKLDTMDVIYSNDYYSLYVCD